MMKSPLLGSYLKSLEALNDQLCYYMFATEEINRKLSDFENVIMHHYTPQVFANNLKAKKINVKLEDLPMFQEKNITFTFGAYFSTSYEVLVGYLEDSIELLKDTNTASFVKKNKNSPEETYFDTMLASGITPPDNEIIDTLSYMRLRRNSFTHRHETLNTTFELLINNKGSSLNTYWRARKLCNHIDFNDKNVDRFSEDITLDLIILIRIILLSLDSNLYIQLDTNGLIDYLAKKQFAHLKESVNKVIEEKRAKKLKTVLESNYGIHCNTEELIQYVKKYGTR